MSVIVRPSHLLFSVLLPVLLLLSCADDGHVLSDALNDAAYRCHYRDLDSTAHYARRAFAASALYPDGRAEALNHLAFVSLARMDYDGARLQLDSIPLVTANQIELLVAYVQQMRLCQRRSANREFYDYREQALQCLRRIDEDRSVLSPRQQRRLLYAETEMAIVTSTYYYYVGLERQSSESLLAVGPLVERDTAQLLNYLYNVGAGGVVSAATEGEVSQQEFDHLMRCYLLSLHSGHRFFTATALEALAEHLMDDGRRRQLVADNMPALKFLNPGDVADDRLLPVLLAERALRLFIAYGDTYQIAGAYRTLASAHLALDDYGQALRLLETALSDSGVSQAPDLVASIHEQLSVAYAALDDKGGSDRHRNIYLDLQEDTRQDRQLEARAGQLEQSLHQTGRLLWAVAAALLLLVAMIAVYQARRRHRRRQPDRQLQEHEEELHEQIAMMRQQVEKGERRHLEQRAKVSLATAILPLIDRIIHAADRSAIDYVLELTEEIQRQNTLLTQWIQLRQGELSLRIETFSLQPLFDMVGRSERSFAMKGVALRVLPSAATVKADRVLTLFMLNTLADNARKFTPEGGTVTISASETADYVELSVADTGCGISDEEQAQLFTKGVHASTATSATGEGGHGYGLLNCKGIIEKYRKMSTLFSVCQLTVESRVGEGSRFAFRLPKGAAAKGHRPSPAPLMALIGLMALAPFCPLTSHPTPLTTSPPATERLPLARAAIYADSAYFSNINGTYERTLLFADSCRRCLNADYLHRHPHGADTLLLQPSAPPLHPSTTPSEIVWLHDSVDTNYGILLDMRNETAVAALALHQWALYHYNNRIYTQLYKELSADTTLDDYCRKMQQSQTNRQVAVILLVLLILGILAALFWQLMQSMKRHASQRRKQQDRIDMMGDELQRLTMESNALHVSNAVLDNTLSTLKHETMYYPSRVRQLAEAAAPASAGNPAGSPAAPASAGIPAVRLAQLKELVTYYRDLYALLSAHFMSQVQACRLHLKALDNGILGDENLIRFLFEILRRENGQRQPPVAVTPRDDRYVECRVQMDALDRTNLFTPDTADNIPWLLCRQIVRDHGEATNRRACAIRAEKSQQGVTIVIILPRDGRQHQ